MTEARKIELVPDAAKDLVSVTLPEVMTLLQPPDHVPSVYWLLRRGFDVALAFGILLLGAPLFACIALAIKLESAGPVVFHQTRVGRGLRWFTIYKFRTMYKDVSPHPVALFDPKIQAYRRPIGREDPRQTRVGNLLRKFSLDELPQVVNVLKGDMSFIGPRPLALAESMAVPIEALCRYSVPAGMSGLAQIRNRHTMVESSRFAADIEYVRTVSFSVDLKIFFKTFQRLYDRGV